MLLKILNPLCFANFKFTHNVHVSLVVVCLSWFINNEIWKHYLCVTDSELMRNLSCPHRYSASAHAPVHYSIRLAAVALYRTILNASPHTRLIWTTGKTNNVVPVTWQIATINSLDACFEAIRLQSQKP